MNTLGNYELNQIYTGDARQLAAGIPAASIDLIFTDPVYWQIDDYRWLSEMASRVLKPGGNLLTYYGMYFMPETIAALATHLDYRWHLHERMLNSQNTIWKYRMNSQIKPAFWFSRGAPNLISTAYKCDFVTKISEGKIVNHEWSKGQSTVLGWIEKFTVPGAIVLDPFGGGGTIPAACRMLGRNFLAFEIDPATANKARQRIANTQPPLLVLDAPEQMTMEYAQ